MKINILCPDCSPALQRQFVVELVPKNNCTYDIECPNGHRFQANILYHEFQKLFEVAINALSDNYYREAIGSFAASYERFMELFLRIIMKTNGIEGETVTNGWEKVARQSERQLGAFIFLFILEFKAQPSLLSEDHVSLPAKSVKELIALAKARPGTLNYGSAGIGNTMHLAGALFSTMAGVKMVHVPFKGAGPAIIDLIGGQLELVFVNIPPVLSHVRAGKLNAIGVTTRQRASVLPDVPTISESGLTGYEVTTWFRILGPAGLPKEIVARLNGAIVSAMGARDLRERFTELGSEPGTSSPEQFGAFIRNDITSWAKVVKMSGAKAD